MKQTRILAVSALVLSFFASLTVASQGPPEVRPPEIKESFSYESARSILGNDLITPDEIATASRVSYTRDQLTYFAQTLPQESILRWAKGNGYAVVAGPPAPMSLLNIRFLKSEIFLSLKNDWYADENFAKDDKVTTVWLIIRKEPVPNSIDKSWNDQSWFFSKDDQVPNAGEMSWFITTFYEVRGVRLFERLYVRTSSVSLVGYHVNIGGFGKYGFGVSGNCWDDDRCYYVGVAASRKF